MYNIPLYKRKLYSLIKEEFNLKSNAQAGQYLKRIFDNIVNFSIWMSDGVDKIIDTHRTGYFECFSEFCGYKDKLFAYKYLFPLDYNSKRVFKDKYVKLLFCKYYYSDFKFKTFYF